MNNSPIEIDKRIEALEERLYRIIFTLGKNNGKVFGLLETGTDFLRALWNERKRIPSGVLDKLVPEDLTYFEKISVGLVELTKESCLRENAESLLLDYKDAIESYKTEYTRLMEYIQSQKRRDTRKK